MSDTNDLRFRVVSEELFSCFYTNSRTRVSKLLQEGLSLLQETGFPLTPSMLNEGVDVLVRAFLVATELELIADSYTVFLQGVNAGSASVLETLDEVRAFSDNPLRDVVGVPERLQGVHVDVLRDWYERNVSEHPIGDDGVFMREVFSSLVDTSPLPVFLLDTAPIPEVVEFFATQLEVEDPEEQDNGVDVIESMLNEE